MTDDNTSATPGGAPDMEARLRHALVEKAGDEPRHGADWGDLAARLASSTRRRQRVLAGAAALALLVGAAGGYLGEAAASPVPVAARATVPKANSGGATTPRGAAPSAGAMAMCPEGSSGAPGVASGVGSTGIGSATRLFIRTTPDAVTVRVYRDDRTGVPCLGAPTPGTGSSTGSAGSTIMPLLPTGQGATIELSDADAVGQGAISSPLCFVSPGAGAGTGAAAGGGTGSSTGAGGGVSSGTVVPPEPGNTPVLPPATTTTTAPADTTTTAPTTTTTTTPPPTIQPSVVVPGVFGVSEGDPVWWVAVEVPDTVSTVRMTFPDGATDAMAPVSGIAVLAHRVPVDVATGGSGPDEVRGSLQLLGGDGGVLDTVTLPQAVSPVPVPAPVPVPGPTPEPLPATGTTTIQGGGTVTPGAIAVCPSSTSSTTPAQSSGTTEKR
jgi:hypothetical protein